VPAGIALGGPFELIDHTGARVTEASYGERWRLMFFGFTFCPDVCPTELGRVADVLDLLGADAARVAALFVSVDPERDTPAAMADYVGRFHPALTGLTGSPQQVAAIARAFRVFYARVQPPNLSDYLLDHSTFLYLAGPDGRVRALFRADTPPEAIAAAVRGQLRGA
jgi:protein SCO1/2